MKAVCLVFSSMPFPLLMGCSDEITSEQGFHVQEEIVLSGEISQTYVTRANDGGFADGDRMGVFIVDYVGGKPGALSESGNRANNALFEYNAESYKWSCATTFYYRDPNTAVDVYGYYPYTAAVNNVDEWLFTTESDQSAEGAYEKSDFLWAKASDVKPSADVINLTYTHRMAGVMVTLTRGEGIGETEWEKVSKAVTVDNMQRMGCIDMKSGTVTATGKTDRGIVMCPQGTDVWRAVVVPQEVKSGTRLFGFTIDGTSYHYTRTQDLTLTAGKLHRFSLKIDKKGDGDYTLSLVDMEITPWENDKVTHLYSISEYVVVSTDKPGTLKATIEAMGKDCCTIKNLKIIGPITNADFDFMRDEMSELQMLNMKETVCTNANVGWEWEPDYMDNAIPSRAFWGKRSLRRLVLPDNIVCIGNDAFLGIGLDVNSTLYLPKSLKRLGDGAFRDIGEAGTLVLNDSLEYIGGLCFYGTAFSCELNFPKTLRYLGGGSIGQEGNNSYFFKVSGHFRVPEEMEYMGGGNSSYDYGPFEGIIYDEVGEIIVPHNIKLLSANMFPKFTKGCTVTFHDDLRQIGPLSTDYGGGLERQRIINHVSLPPSVEIIGTEAFRETTFGAGITLPSTVKYLGHGAFRDTRGLGDFVLPEGIVQIPWGCFARSDIRSITLPESVEDIGDIKYLWVGVIDNSGAFENSDLQRIVINKNCSSIGRRAFAGCSHLQTIICLNPEPPTLIGDGEYEPFSGCDMDHLVLEVPEQSIELYRNTSGWSKIHFITAYHELAVGKSELTCLDGGMEYETLMRAEGGWEVSDCPDWCHVTPSSSQDRRTEITIKVDPTAQGNERSGRIIFKLKGKDYTTYTDVHQLAYEYAENSEIVLQTASAGGNEIPIFIAGEGYTAEQIADGTYMRVMREVYEHLFSIEPLKSYRDHFTVSTSLAVSPDAGISTVDEPKTTKFGVTLDAYGLHINSKSPKSYAQKMSQHITNGNIGKALIVVVANHDAFMATNEIMDDGCGVALCCRNTDTYPYDFRGLVQHFALGRTFGRLAREDVEHFDFIKACTCPLCNGLPEYYAGAAKGWYKNISLIGGMNSVPWRHLVFDPRYSDIVDVYEGGYRHQRGVFRSENMTCMNNYISYFGTWQRELIVRRIMELAGKPYSFEEFVAKDSREGIPE